VRFGNTAANRLVPNSLIDLWWFWPRQLTIRAAQIVDRDSPAAPRPTEIIEAAFNRTFDCAALMPGQTPRMRLRLEMQQDMQASAARVPHRQKTLAARAREKMTAVLLPEYG